MSQKADQIKLWDIYVLFVGDRAENGIYSTLPLEYSKEEKKVIQCNHVINSLVHR